MTLRAKAGLSRSGNPNGRPIASHTPLANELRRREWTSKDLAARISISYRTVQRWMRGQNPTPAWVWQSLKNIDEVEKLRQRVAKQSHALARLD
jgi:transcriptional regulator with XRE-family HTH domain